MVNVARVATACHSKVAGAATHPDRAVENYRKEGHRIGREDAELRQAVPYKFPHCKLAG
jgi:hypothetical protein